MRRRQDEAEMGLWKAWQGERFARERRLKQFAQYVRELKPRQSARDMLSVLRSFQASGAKMTIRRVEHGK